MRIMSTDSGQSFSFVSSDDEDDIEIIPPADIAEAIAGVVSSPAVPTFSSSDSKNVKKVSAISANSCTVTDDDSKDAVDSADSGSRSNKISANQTENNNTKRATRKMPPSSYYFIPLCIVLFLIATVIFYPYDYLIARSFFRWPTEIRVQSVTLSAFSSASWRSREISARGTMSLEFKNVLMGENVIYDPILISISSNGADITLDTLTPFAQLPSSKSDVNFTFSASIDASAVEEFITPDGVVSLNVSVLTGLTIEKMPKWSENLFFQCSDVRLQFFQGNDVAEMVNQKPVLFKCESHKDQIIIPEIPDSNSKFHDVINKIQRIVEVFYLSS